jgi:hypothetical protein
MSHSFEKSLLMLRNNSPLSTLHGISCSMTRLFFEHQVKANTKTVLNGVRGIRYPFLALMTRRSMGPARHVLSQKVVAGTMTVHPPYKPSQPAGS